jgi:7-cyano-7-deazaguanine synthase
VFAGRNLVFAALAIARAQAGGFGHIAVGCNASDWHRFPDCRPAFWSALRTAAEAYGIRVGTPLIHMSKHEVVELAGQLGVPIELTWSCYSPRDGEPCQECLACTVRQEALSACS